MLDINICEYNATYRQYCLYLSIGGANTLVDYDLVQYIYPKALVAKKGNALTKRRRSLLPCWCRGIHNVPGFFLQIIAASTFTSHSVTRASTYCISRLLQGHSMQLTKGSFEVGFKVLELLAYRSKEVRPPPSLVSTFTS